MRNYLVSNETKLVITENISPIDVWKQKFPQANELALDLLSKLLCFNAKKRMTVREAIQHEIGRAHV